MGKYIALGDSDLILKYWTLSRACRCHQAVLWMQLVILANLFAIFEWQQRHCVVFCLFALQYHEQLIE